MGLKSECPFFQSGYVGSKTTSEKGPRDLRVLKAPCRFFHLENKQPPEYRESRDTPDTLGSLDVAAHLIPS